jgi:hypothetical protein
MSYSGNTRRRYPCQSIQWIALAGCDVRYFITDSDQVREVGMSDVARCLECDKFLKHPCHGFLKKTKGFYISLIRRPRGKGHQLYFEISTNYNYSQIQLAFL